MLVSDAFGLPRDPEHAIHGLIGEWEFRSIWPERRMELPELLLKGWKVFYEDSTHISIVYTHWERCGCGKEAHHG